MARVLIDEAYVRVGADSRAGERDARRAGERFGKEFTKTADRQASKSDLPAKLADQVEQASRKVQKSRDAEAKAAGRLRVAEARLEELRKKEKVSAAQLAAAEESVADARRNLVSQQQDVLRASRQVRDSQERLAAAHRDAAEAADRQRDSTSGLRDELRRLPGDARLPRRNLAEFDVKLNPLNAEFDRDVKAALARISRDSQLAIPLTAEGERLRRQVGERIREIERTVNGSIPFDPELAAGFRRELQARVNAVARTVRSSVRVGVDVDRDGALRGTLGSVLSLGGRASTLFGGAFSAAMDRASSSVQSLAGGLISTGVGFFTAASRAALLTPILGLVAGGITAVGGAAAAALIGLPVLLTAIIGPAAAVALGFDGIRKAAEQLTPHVEALRTRLSTTFENWFTPVFESLIPLFPAMEAGLDIVAIKLSEVSQMFADTVLHRSSMGDFLDIFVGIGAAIDGAKFGLDRLLDSILGVLSKEGLFLTLGQTIGGVAERFGDLIDRASSNGLLFAALNQLKDVLFETTDLLGELAIMGLEFFVGAGPGITGFLHEIGEALRAVDWRSVGETFGGLLERVGKALNDIPASTWENLIDAIADMSEEIVKLVEGGGLQLLIEDFTRLIEGLTPAIRLLFGIADAAIWLSVKLTELANIFGDFGGWVRDAIETLMDWLGISSPAQKLIDIGLSIIEGLMIGLADGPRKALEKAKELGQNLLDGLANAKDLLVGRGSEAVDGFTRGIDDKLGAVRDKARGIKDSVVAALSDAKEWLFGAGVDAVTGFISGITSKIGDAARAAGDMARRAYEAARNAIDSSSPSRLFASLGQDTIAGYVLGLRERLAPMLAQVRSIFDQVFATAAAQVPERLIQAGDGSGSDFTHGVRRGVGSGVSAGPGAEQIAAALAAALPGLRLSFVGPSVVEIVDDEHRRVARR